MVFGKHSRFLCDSSVLRFPGNVITLGRDLGHWVAVGIL